MRSHKELPDGRQQPEGAIKFNEKFSCRNKVKVFEGLSAMSF